MKIFLDDVRDPQHCLGYMHHRIGALNPIYGEEWVTVRNYEEFVNTIILSMDQITHVSFDHDLAEGHYHKNLQEGVIDYYSPDFMFLDNKTGYHAAVAMKGIYQSSGRSLPVIFVHSMNPVGYKNIKDLFGL